MWPFAEYWICDWKVQRFPCQSLGEQSRVETIWVRRMKADRSRKCFPEKG